MSNKKVTQLKNEDDQNFVKAKRAEKHFLQAEIKDCKKHTIAFNYLLTVQPCPKSELSNYAAKTVKL